ncbi:MAG: hypothetical protein ACOCZ7_00570 [Armatimonadota bacterium]
MAAAAVALLATPASADRLINFSVVTDSIAGVRTAAVNADGMVVMRLRSKDGGSLARKAEVVASRLTELALTGLEPEQVAVEQINGDWSVTGAGKLIITADAETAEASALEPKSLCESWQKRLRELLDEPYLCIEPHQLLIVPYNEKRTIRFGGTIAGDTIVESMAPGVARVEKQAGRAVVHGAGTGTTVVIIEAGDAHAAITVEIKKWAARIADGAMLTKLPGGLPSPMREAALLNAALSAVDLEPDATVRVTDSVSTAAGYLVSLHAAGVDYLPLSRDLIIGVRQESTGVAAPRMLALSNYPEKVAGTGALMRQRLEARTPTRLMWHHKNYAGRPIVAAVRLVNAGTEPARVRIGWAEAGPNPDEIYVGYNAMLRYWQTVRRGAGFVANIPPGNAFETSAMRMGQHDVISGLMDLMAEVGDNLYLEMIARDPADVPGGFTRISATVGELPLTPYCFPAVLESEVDYEVGGRYGHLSIGRETIENGEGFILEGAYGVNHLITVNASNPTEAPAMLELALRAGGGVARTVTVVDGQLNSSGILSAGHEQLLERRPLLPGVSTKIRLEIIPTAGSNLPFTLVVRPRAR